MVFALYGGRVVVPYLECSSSCLRVTDYYNEHASLGVLVEIGPWRNHSMEVEAGKLLDRTMVMYHCRIDYNTICKSCTIVVK